MKPALIVPLALAACATPPPPSPFGGQACRAADYAPLIGAPLAAVTLPADLNDRVIGPGARIDGTRDPGRLNLFVDDSGTILRIACG